MKNTIFFDRDGVINELVGDKKNRGPRDLSELYIREDFRNFMAQISYIKFNFVVITNQPDISRGKLSVTTNSEIKDNVLQLLPNGTLYLECPHDNSEGCMCRKPNNGMIESALKSLKAKRTKSILIGDTWTDIVAGQKSKIFSVLLKRTGSLEKTSQGFRPKDFKADQVIESLVDLLNVPQFRELNSE